jgi:hypothetical protein
MLIFSGAMNLHPCALGPKNWISNIFKDEMFRAAGLFNFLKFWSYPFPFSQKFQKSTINIFQHLLINILPNSYWVTLFLHAEESLGGREGLPVALVAALSGLGAAMLITACGLVIIYRRPKSRQSATAQVQPRESDAWYEQFCMW